MSEAVVALAVVPSDQLERVRNLGAIATIDTAEGEALAVDGLAFIQTVSRNLERARKELVDPLNKKVKDTNATFKAITEPIDAAEERVKTALLDWRRRERDRIAAEQERVRRENEERERAAADRLAKEAAAVVETTVDKAKAAGFTEEEADELAAMEAADVVAAAPAPLREVAPAPIANTTKATLGSSTTRPISPRAIACARLRPRSGRDGMSVIPKIRNCARCGGEHIHLPLYELPGEPIGDARFWCVCPTTGAPILVTIRDRKTKGPG